MKPQTICNVPGCPNISISGGRCAKHQRIPFEGRTWKNTGYGKDWLKIRSAILIAEPFCRQCGQRAVTVDHIIPKARGGSDARSNLRSLCESCRKTKDAKDAAEGRKLSQFVTW